MKLWHKTIAALMATGIIAGATIGGVALFQKYSPNAQGNSFASSQRMVNGFPVGKTLENLTISDFDTTIIGQNGSFDYNPEKDEVKNGSKWVSWEDFREIYIENFNDMPTLTVTFGPAIFTNEYLDAVGPKDFSDYVLWFLKNVSWGSDLGSLEHFSLKRGVKTAGSSIILGEHVNTNQEKTTIEFYPDAFFGSLPAYSQESGWGQQSDNLLLKLTDLNNTLLTLEDVKALVENSRNIELNQGGQFHIRTISPAQTIDDPSDPTRNGKMGYEAYAEIFPGLIDSVLAKFPYLAKKLNGPHVVKDTQIQQDGFGGVWRKDIFVPDGDYYGIDTSARIPYLALLSASDPDFKGVGINWLKYVGHHEYGHHQTLTDAQDISEDGLFAGGASQLKGLSSQGMYSSSVLNNYLLARSHSLGITGSKADGTGTGQFIKFIEGKTFDSNKNLNAGTPETVADVFGSLNSNAIEDAVNNPKRRAVNITLGDLEETSHARANGTSVSDLTIMNAWDIASGTINPGYKGDALVYAKSSANRWILVKLADELQNNLFIKDVRGNTIEINSDSSIEIPQFVIQRWDFDNSPVVYKNRQSQNGNTFEFAVPKNAPAGFDPSSAKRHTVVFMKANNQDVPIVSNDCDPMQLASVDNSQIGDFANQLSLQYDINGWFTDATNTKLKGVALARTIWEQGQPMDAAAISSNPNVFNKRQSSAEEAANYFISTRDSLVAKTANTPIYGNASAQMDIAGKAILGSDSLGDQLTSFTMSNGFNPFTQFYAMPYQFGSINATGTYLTIGQDANSSYFVGALPTGIYSPERNDSAPAQLGHGWTTSLNGSANSSYVFVASQDPNLTLSNSANTQTHVFGWGVHNNTTGELIPSPSQPTMASDPTLLNNVWSDGDIKTYDWKMIWKDSLLETTGTSVKTAFGFNYQKDVLQAQFTKWRDVSTTDLDLYKYISTFTFDPFADFEYSSENGPTVIKKERLEQIFDWAKIKALNANMSDAQIQSALTWMLVSSGLLFVKEELKSIDDFKIKDQNNMNDSEKSFLAFITQGNSKDAAKLSAIPTAVGPQSAYYIYPKIDDLNKLVDELSAYKSVKKEQMNNSIDPTKLSYSEYALLIGSWHYSIASDTALNNHDATWDLAYAVKAGPTSNIYDYLLQRNDDELDSKFSDYTLNIAEMINRDYIQITYQPSTNPLPNQPSWFGGTSEAESGWEFSISPEATSKYYANMLFQFRGTQYFEATGSAIQKTFHFSWTTNSSTSQQELVMDKDENGKEYERPSKGIIAAADIMTNWHNYIEPHYIGRTVAQADGYLKDDFIRREVGQELYDDSGNLVGNIAQGKIWTLKNGQQMNQGFNEQFGTINDSAIFIDPKTYQPLVWVTKVSTLGITAEARSNHPDWDHFDANGNLLDAQGNQVAYIDTLSNGAQALVDAEHPSITYALMYKNLILNGSEKFDNQSSTPPTISPVKYIYQNDKIVELTGVLDGLSIPDTSVKWSVVGQQIYDTNGDSIVDNSIRIRDLQGNLVTDRARAIWMWLLESKGMGVTQGNRTIEGLWRSPSRDASYLYGYVKKDVSERIKFIEFKDNVTGENKYLPVAVGLDNLHYFSHRTPNDNVNDQITGRSVEDEGYTAWATDYVAMGGYRDAFLLSGHNYTMNFVDANHKFVQKVDLGSNNAGIDSTQTLASDPNQIYTIDNRSVICENGKAFGKAPNYIKAENGEAVIYVNDQFNN